VYKILPNILLSMLTPYADEIIGDHQCESRHKQSTIDHIFCISQILEKKWEFNEAMHQLFMVIPCINDIKCFIVQLMHSIM